MCVGGIPGALELRDPFLYGGDGVRVPTWTAVVAFVATCGSASAAGPRAIHDAAVEFSGDRNPRRPWQYGFTAGASLTPDAFRLFRRPERNGVFAFWHPNAEDNGGADYYPYAAANRSGEARADPTRSWAIRTDELALEASNVGQYAVIRFVAPRPGRYRIKVRFAGVHFRLSSTDVHVLMGATSLFDAVVDGYGGDPTFHRIEGASPEAAWTGTVRLDRDEAVSFAVGYGPNRTHFDDTTALRARVRWLGDGA
jgi:hypothetical protein